MEKGFKSYKIQTSRVTIRKSCPTLSADRFNMDLASSFICFLLSLLLMLVQAKGRNDSTCPKSFSCGNFTDLTFPYSLSTQPDCRIMFLSGCDAETYPRIKMLPEGGRYYALEMHNSSVWLGDTNLQTMLTQHKCQTFNKNFSLPNSPFMFFHMVNINNFFKCISTSNNASNTTQKMNSHFVGYNMYSGCEDFSIYDKPSQNDDEYIGADNLPTNCSLIRLPVHSFHGDLFNMLGPEILVEWNCLMNVPNVIMVEVNARLITPTNFLVTKHSNSRNIKKGLPSDNLVHGGHRKKILWYKYIRFWESNIEDHQKVEEFLKNYGAYAPNIYSYTNIKRITDRFSSKLGQGGFGNVYRGSLSNGSEVAVKALNELKGSGEDFVNEVASISRTSHVNIVSLVGFCFEGHKRALVYEFMPNGSLGKFIYEERSDSVRQLGWPILYKIALGIARGLEYLHRGCNTRILHFDIKPHNILLDEDFCPKISDFGLAKMCMKQESIVSINLGGVSHKSDVYSYGMMVLEMVGGRKNVDEGVDRTSEIYFPHWLYQRVELDEEL
ncbi:hypothetical protein H5410_025373 [Solanum commersonii]|uniref:non-specific serine/threonine protein kinase n=1 Tax=Solanum commersonii TaxID=4109 RepID=A0A9J5YTK7_SOLCO|nr:hypothetical protein H5410_025373 [Solanum commersonii]